MSDTIIEQIIQMKKRLAAEREARAEMDAERKAMADRAAEATAERIKDRPALGIDEIKKRLA